MKIALMFSVKGLFTNVSVMGTKRDSKTLPINKIKTSFYLIINTSSTIK